MLSYLKPWIPIQVEGRKVDDMLKEFLAEAAKIEASLLAGVEFPDYNADPVGDGETVIATLADPWLKALFLAYKATFEAAGAANLTEAEAAAMGRKELEQKGEDALLEYAKLAALGEVIWTDLRFGFRILESRIGLRAGWVLVKAENPSISIEEPPPELMAKLTGVGGPDRDIHIVGLPGSVYGPN